MNPEYIKRLVKNPSVRGLISKVLDGNRLTVDDGIVLMKKAETGLLGMLAGHLAETRNIDRKKKQVFPVLITKDCKYKCPACQYAHAQNDTIIDKSTLLNELEEVSDIEEIIISSGVSGQLNLPFLVDLISGIKWQHPGQQIRGLRAIHIYDLAQREGIQPVKVLEKLKYAGLDSLLGGDALIFRDEMRSKMQDYTLSKQQWLDLHQQAHETGYLTEASMTYGHFESVEDRLRHLENIRDLQDKTNGFDGFIPVKFRADSGISKFIPATSGLEDMRVFAVSRIFLDNIQDLDAFTIIGDEGWQEVLRFGANRVTIAHPDSTKYLPQYGTLF
ncbi:MAG: radical SAM protein [Bacteroidales bacterium]